MDVNSVHTLVQLYPVASTKWFWDKFLNSETISSSLNRISSIQKTKDNTACT